MRRTRDIAESWALDVTKNGGKVTVFSDNAENLKFDSLNIITLQGVNDNMYPPQRKSYSVIRNVFNNRQFLYLWTGMLNILL